VVVVAQPLAALVTPAVLVVVGVEMAAQLHNLTVLLDKVTLVVHQQALPVLAQAVAVAQALLVPTALLTVAQLQELAEAEALV
jgi:hypothetical protein